MGMFSSRPEEPTEWAGLPSEPLRERSAAEQLDADTAAEAAALNTATSPITSISIPIAMPDPSEMVDGGADGD